MIARAPRWLLWLVDIHTTFAITDYRESIFSFSNLDLDEKLAVFKGDRSNLVEEEDPKHSIIYGLLFRLRRDGPNPPPLNSTEDGQSPKISLGHYHDTRFVRVDGQQSIFVVQVRGGLNNSQVPISRLIAKDQAMLIDWRMLFTSFFNQIVKGAKQKGMVC